MREIESMNECEIASMIEEMKNDGRTTEETEGKGQEIGRCGSCWI